MTYYRPDLAWIHHAGYSQHVARVFPGIAALLGPARCSQDALVVDTCWRRSDETHHNVTFEAAEAVEILRERGAEARVQPSFGDETLPPGLVVLVGRRR